jgi:hypothetical protein
MNVIYLINRPVVSLSRLFRLGMVLLCILCSSCMNIGKTAIAVDKRDPESVLRAYFEAWGRDDWAAEASFMDEKFAGMAPEPVDSIRVLEIHAFNTGSTERSYHVLFEIKVKGEGVSMQSGQYNWNYYLSWDAQRGSWLISNYGCC